jgi:hypothetical protein
MPGGQDPVRRRGDGPGRGRGDGDAAGGVLAAGGHAPLLAQIRALAERARIPLQPAAADGTKPVPTPRRWAFLLAGGPGHEEVHRRSNDPLVVQDAVMA